MNNPVPYPLTWHSTSAKYSNIILPLAGISQLSVICTTVIIIKGFLIYSDIGTQIGTAHYQMLNKSIFIWLNYQPANNLLYYVRKIELLVELSFNYLFHTSVTLYHSSIN